MDLIAASVACLRALFAWAERRRDIEVSPVRTAEIRIELPKRLPRCLTAMELRRLFAVRGGARPTIALAVLLLFTTGMRVAELTALSAATSISSAERSACAARAIENARSS